MDRSFVVKDDDLHLSNTKIILILFSILLKAYRLIHFHHGTNWSFQIQINFNCSMDNKIIKFNVENC